MARVGMHMQAGGSPRISAAAWPVEASRRCGAAGAAAAGTQFPCPTGMRRGDRRSCSAWRASSDAALRQVSAWPVSVVASVMPCAMHVATYAPAANPSTLPAAPAPRTPPRRR